MDRRFFLFAAGSSIDVGGQQVGNLQPFFTLPSANPTVSTST